MWEVQSVLSFVFVKAFVPIIFKSSFFSNNLYGLGNLTMIIVLYSSVYEIFVYGMWIFISF